MKTRHLLMAMLLSSVAGGPWAVPSALAGDNIERSCTARYLIRVHAVRRCLIDPEHRFPPETFHEFTVRRGCGRAVPNLCRQRASEAALQCMMADVRASGPTQAAAACTSNGVQNYHAMPSGGRFELGENLKGVACHGLHACPPRSNEPIEALLAPYAARVTLIGVVEGDDGCGGGTRHSVSRVLLDDVAISCPSMSASHWSTPTPMPMPARTPMPMHRVGPAVTPTPAPRPTMLPGPRPTGTPTVGGKPQRGATRKRL